MYNPGGLRALGSLWEWIVGGVIVGLGTTVKRLYLKSRQVEDDLS